MTNATGLENRPLPSVYHRRPSTPASGSASFRIWLAVRNGKPRVVRFPHRIMVGVDFTRASDAALRLVLAIASTTGTLVDLVHVFDGFTEAFVCGDRPVLDRVDSVLAGVANALRVRARDGAAQGATCEVTSLVGAPALEISQHAEKTGADLLVLGLGADTRGSLGRAWSATAAKQVLRTGMWRERPLVSSTYL